MARRRVIVVGGGVAGMTVAHELAERGHDVTILERRTDRVGGKSRTEPFTRSAKGGRLPLPGEHGFRFFPGFYKHIDDTLRRTPFGNNPNGVLDNLVTCETGLFACMDKPAFPMLVHFPRTVEQLREAAAFAWNVPDDVHRLGLTNDDFQFYFQKLLQIATSSDERRFGEYERIGWWDFVEAEERSKAFQLYLATGMTRSAVATKAEKANTRTIGVIGLQLVYDMMKPGGSADRVLVGPTTDTWLDAWALHLRNLGVRYERGRTVTKIEFDGRRVTGLVVDGKVRRDADDYVIALPVEVAARLISPEIKARDPILAQLDVLATQVNWMNGIQFYMTEDVTVTPGHINAVDSPWALTALCQQQFWPWIDLRDYGDGSIRSILSVDISAWDVPGLSSGPSGGRTAVECPPDVVAAETWYQLSKGLNFDKQRLPDTYASYWLDDDIQRVGKRRGPVDPLVGVRDGGYVNLEPLLVNLVNAWSIRPNSYTNIPNLFLAGDYVRTNTDFASMEGACESGRRAAQAILSSAGLSGRVDVWPLEEPAVFEPLKRWDAERYARGLPWAPLTDAPVEAGSTLGHLADRAIDKVEQLAEAWSPRNLMRDLAAKVAGALSPATSDAQRRAEAIIDRAAGRGESVPGPETDWMMLQRWTELGFLHWRIPVETIRPLVPSKLELDLYRGEAWISLVPMRMSELMLRIGDPPGANDFAELNVRTYVKHGSRHGVYFLRIDCPDVLAVLGANLLTGIAYRISDVTHTPYPNESFHFVCAPEEPDRLEVMVTPEGEPFQPVPGSLEAFLANRSAAFTISPLGRLHYGEVAHDPWRVRKARAEFKENSALDGLGIDGMKPDLVLYAEEMESVMWPFEAVE